jgi:translation initiation factor IF-3
VAEKVGIRKSRAEKEIELNWSIREHDLAWSLKKIRDWLEDGKRVSVSLKRKRKRLETDETECMELIGQIRDAVKSVRGTSEAGVEGKLGLAMVLDFQAKDKRYQEQGVRIPWEINDKALSAQIQVLQGALKKGKSVTVELGSEESDERRAKLPRQEILQQVRSACRQVKDAMELKSSGGLDSAMTLMMEGKYNGKRRELELPWGIKDSDLKIRLRWISDWLGAGKEVKLYLGERNDEISSQFAWDKLHLELYSIRSVHPSMTVREEGSLVILDPLGKQKEERHDSTEIGAPQ